MKNPRLPLLLEPLESRDLLAAGTKDFLEPVVLEIGGSKKDDVIEIRQIDTQLNIWKIRRNRNCWNTAMRTFSEFSGFACRVKALASANQK